MLLSSYLSLQDHVYKLDFQMDYNHLHRIMIVHIRTIIHKGKKGEGNSKRTPILKYDTFIIDLLGTDTL